MWDAENRLVGMTNNSGVGPKYGMKFVYDAKGRRIQKFVATNGVPVYTNRFLYDGWISSPSWIRPVPLSEAICGGTIFPASSKALVAWAGCWR